MVETAAKGYSNTHVHDRECSWLGTLFQKSGGVILLMFTKYFNINVWFKEIALS